MPEATRYLRAEVIDPEGRHAWANPIVFNRDLATEEEAEKTAEHLSKLIDKKQKDFEKTLKTLGFEQ